MFVDRATNTIIATVNVRADGVVTYSWPVNLVTAKSKGITLEFIVSYYYSRNSSTDNAIVQVAK